MNKRPTPETDAEHAQFKMGGFTLDFCRKLERERDEARERAAKWESSFDAMERAGAEQARRADENREWALRAERERDEARKELNEIRAERDLARLSSMESDKAHDRMVGELEKVYKERDEARAAIVGWENKWKCAVEMAAQAEVERDGARNMVSGLSATVDRLHSAWDEAQEALARITEAAQAVVDRWEQPAWKDAEPTAVVIYRLRDALGREAE